MDKAPAQKRIVISDLISPSAVKLHLTGQNRDEVLSELVSQIKEIADRPNDQATLLHALQEREQLHSTGVGDGVALPHARNALVGLVDHPIIIFGRHDTGVNFGSVDGSPARLFFLLVAPTVSQHLAILARLSRALRNPKLRTGLLAVETPQKAIELIHETERTMQ